MEYTLLIVEDEPLVRQTLSDAGEWARRGFRLVASAGSAAEAMALAGRHRPDVILADICMPGMSGLDMAAHMQEHGVSCAFVILSGHNRFEYAQQAVRLGVFDYLTKPVDETKFDDTFHRLKKRLDVDRSGRPEGVPAGDALEVFQGIFLVSLLTQRLSPLYMDTLMAELGLGTPKPAYRLAAIRLMQSGRESDGLPEDAPSFWTGRGHMATAHQGLLVVFWGLVEDSAEEALGRALVDFESFVRGRPGFADATLRAGVSARFARLAESRASYRQALTALAYHFYAPGPPHAFEKLPVSFAEAAPFAQPAQAQQAVVEAALALDERAAIAALQALFEPVTAFRPRDVEGVFALCNGLQSQLLARISQHGLDGSAYLADMPPLSGASSLRELSALAERRLQTLIRALSTHMRAQSNRVVWDACEYVKRHIEERLTVGDVADAIHVSPGYLSRAFRKATGDTVNNYISLQKTQCAQQFLRGTRLSVQEIAYKLGFPEYRYFCTLFKKVTGVTPLSYRHSILTDSKGRTEI
ncbi:MAG TPA: response regulator [Clostridia bacterium]|nr:response regulator [Clostridia bacterium]